MHWSFGLLCDKMCERSYAPAKTRYGKMKFIPSRRIYLIYATYYLIGKHNLVDGICVSIFPQTTFIKCIRHTTHSVHFVLSYVLLLHFIICCSLSLPLILLDLPLHLLSLIVGVCDKRCSWYRKGSFELIEQHNIWNGRVTERRYMCDTSDFGQRNSGHWLSNT